MLFHFQKESIMRPPISATPPIGHVVRQTAHPVTFDWSTLTSDNSIQILHLDSVDHTCDENYFNACGNMNLWKPKTATPSPIHKVSTFYAERKTDDNEDVWVKQAPETTEEIWIKQAPKAPEEIWVKHALESTEDIWIKRVPDSTKESSVKAMSETPKEIWIKRTPDTSQAKTNSHGIVLSTNMFYIPETGTPSPIKNIPFWRQPSEETSEKVFTRTPVSDSDIQWRLRAERKKENHVTQVSRSMSLGFADNIVKNQERGLLRPLRPCVNKTKIGNVKKLPCAVTKTTAATSVIPEHKTVTESVFHNKTNRATNKSNTEIGLRKSAIKQSDSLRLPALMDAQKVKIANFVKSGLKNIIKSKNSFDVNANDSTKGKNTGPSTYRNRRNKLIRKATDIGGLSEFLRKTERRKTMSDFSDNFPDPDSTDITLLKPTERKSVSQEHNEKQEDAALQKFSLKYTPKPWAGHQTENKNEQFVSVNNLKFAKCQRKLVYPGASCATSAEPGVKTTEVFKPNSPDNTRSENEHGKELNVINDVTNEQLPRRPRLGLLGLTKPVTCVTIDELDMNTVRDLKRCIETTNRVSRIKTNGSLMRPRLGQVLKPVVSSPRPRHLVKTTRGVPNSSPGLRSSRMKMESHV